MTKSDIRKKCIEERKTLSQTEVNEYSETICKLIMETEQYKKSKDICLYVAIKNEVNLQYIIDNIESDKKIWLPKVCGKDMDFYLYDSNTKLIEGSFNIPEPDSEEILVPDEDTLVIVPGVAFSVHGDRIGYGAGYYDKYLQLHDKCSTIAVCYDFQLFDQIPHERFDVRMNQIFSEKRQLSTINNIYRIGGR